MMKRFAFLVAAMLVVGCGGPLASVLPTLPTRSSGPSAETSATAATETAAPTEEATPTAEATETLAPETPAETATSEATGTPEATSEATGTPEATTEASPTAEATESSGPTGQTVEVIAGGGDTALANGISATAAFLQRPTGISAIALGTAETPVTNIYVVDGNLGQAFRLAQDGTIDNVAGGLLGPQGIAIAPEDSGPGKVYVADSANNRVAVLNGNGGATAVAGDPNNPAFRGEGTPAKRAWLAQPLDVAANFAGVYVADTSNQRIRFIDSSTGDITTVAGNGSSGFTGDGGPATAAEISNPNGVAVDAANTKLFFNDVGNRRVRMVDLATGIINTVAGNGGVTAVAFDPGLTGLQTPLTRLTAIALDSQGRAYFQNFWGDRGPVIERLDPSGKMTLIVGGGLNPNAGVSPTDFAVGDVLGLAIDPVTGDLLFCQSDQKVYRVNGVAPPA